MELKKLGAEFVGTAVLVLMGIGAAVFAGKEIGTLGIALAFGLALLALVHALGPISGAHLNPAVTLAYVLSRRMKVGTGIQYWVAQFAGGILGAALLVLIRMKVEGVSQKVYGNNGYDSLSQTKASLAGAFLVEILASFIFVFVVLAVTANATNTSVVGLTVGSAFTVGYLLTIPISGGGLNPARSLGPAIFAGSEALGQVWVFLVAPLFGAVLAVFIHAAVTWQRRVIEEPAARPAKRPAAKRQPAKNRK